MKQKMNLKSGMFNGLPAYACALLLLAAGLVLSVLYAVTVGSAELSVGEVYRVILYELFRWGDPEQLGSGAVHDIVWLIRLPRVVLAVLVGMGLSVVGAVIAGHRQKSAGGSVCAGYFLRRIAGRYTYAPAGRRTFRCGRSGTRGVHRCAGGRIFRNRHCRHRGAHHFGKADFGRRCTELALRCYCRT